MLRIDLMDLGDLGDLVRLMHYITMTTYLFTFFFLSHYFVYLQIILVVVREGFCEIIVPRLICGGEKVPSVQ